jgi:hypothetical protein
VKAFFGFLALVALLGGILVVFSPASAKAIAFRAEHYLDPTPPVPPREKPPATNGTPSLSPAPAVSPEWRKRDREAVHLYEAGDFEGAADAWAAAATKAPPAEVLRLRSAKDRALVFSLLAAGAAPVAGADPVASEIEYRRRLDALKEPTAGVWLDLAEYAAARGLRHHLGFVYERAFEKRSQAGEAVASKVKQILKERKEAPAAAQVPVEVLDAVIAELPSTEAAEFAREQSGEGSGIGGSSRRPGVRTQDATKLAEARDCMTRGDEEYRKAIPGSKEVNVHRRRALDLYLKAREIYETVDRESGYASHESEIHDLNRNIVELRKDLPVGK